MFWLAFADRDENPRPEAARPATEPTEAEEPQDSVDVGDEINTVLLRILPWAISLLLHVAVVLIAIFAVWSVRFEMDSEETIIPDARLSKTPGAPLTMRRTRQRTTTSSRRSVSPTRSRQASLVESKVTEERVIGLVGQTGQATSPFGIADAAGSGFDVNFLGSGGNAREIVFVIDASGSLIDTLDFVINELKLTINRLSAGQNFAVLFFQGDNVIEVPPRGMKPADGENKDRVKKWIDPSAGNIIPGGKTSPVKAIERALRYRPQLIFLLSDNITGQGIYQVDQHQLLKSIERANRGAAKINTLQFLYPDPLERDGLKPTMELIASSTGGVYDFIDARDLGIE